MQEFIGKIEHTILKPDLTIKEVQMHCDQAGKWKCATACVPPFFTREAKRILTQSNPSTKLAVVIGFPMGYSAISAKSEEIRRATDEGADEIDAVVNLASIKNGLWNHTQSEIDLLVRATHMKGLLLKLIIEADFLTDEELAHVCLMAEKAGVNYIKNSTGFFGKNASVATISKIKAACSPKMLIKASGGIRTPEAAQALLDAGAHRIGTSATADIIEKMTHLIK